MYYFAYGSNLFRRRIEQRLGSCRLHGSGWLDGYTLQFHKTSKDSSGKCNVYQTGDNTDRVYGALFELTPQQKLTLDGFEGSGYDSKAVPIRSECGDIKAETYIAKPNSIDFSLLPFDWYKAFVVEGAREVGFPSGYIRLLEGTNSLKDPDPGRSHANWSILTVNKGV